MTLGAIAEARSRDEIMRSKFNTYTYVLEIGIMWFKVLKFSIHRCARSDLQGGDKSGKLPTSAENSKVLNNLKMLRDE